MEDDAAGAHAAFERILDLALAYRRSNVLFAGFELGVFAAVARESLDAAALAQRLVLDVRGARDFLDTLVALGLLDRDERGVYGLDDAVASFLDPSHASYVGSFVAYQQRMLAPTWAKLAEALRDGKPKGGVFAAGGFDAYYGCAQTADRFVAAMAVGSVGPARALAARLPWQEYSSLVDVGTAGGTVPIEIAERHPHMRAVGFDLEAMEPTFRRNVAARSLSDRVTFRAGDFLEDPLPQADVVLLGRVLHDWPEATRRSLIGKAFDALPDSGALIVWDALIDDARRAGAQSLMSSLNMLLQTDGGSEYTSAECTAWMRAAGFERVRTVDLFVPYKAVIATRADGGEVAETER